MQNKCYCGNPVTNNGDLCTVCSMKEKPLPPCTSCAELKDWARKEIHDMAASVDARHREVDGLENDLAELQKKLDKKDKLIQHYEETSTLKSSDIQEANKRIKELEEDSDTIYSDGWISVEDRTPAHDVRMLVYTKAQGVFTATRPWSGFKVTHWQPLPSPPKEG